MWSPMEYVKIEKIFQNWSFEHPKKGAWVQNPQALEESRKSDASEIRGKSTLNEEVSPQ